MSRYITIETDDVTDINRIHRMLETFLMVRFDGLLKIQQSDNTFIISSDDRNVVIVIHIYDKLVETRQQNFYYCHWISMLLLYQIMKICPGTLGFEGDNFKTRDCTYLSQSVTYSSFIYASMHSNPNTWFKLFETFLRWRLMPKPLRKNEQRFVRRIRRFPYILDMI